jgi:hypothetical protein
MVMLLNLLLFLEKLLTDNLLITHLLVTFQLSLLTELLPIPLLQTISRLSL